MRVGWDCAGMLGGVGGGRNGKEHHSFFLHPGLMGCVKKHQILLLVQCFRAHNKALSNNIDIFLISL